MRKIIILPLLIIFSFSLIASAQTDWALKSDKDHISVFTKTMPGSPFKAIRVKCSFNTTVSRFVGVLMDINRSIDWIYSTKSVALLKQVSPNELYYYSEVNLPWPAANRDFVAHLVVKQDPTTKTAVLEAENVAGFVPEKKGLVRVLHANGRWTISPAGSNKINIDYVLELDPAGSLPAWLVNMFAAKGPYETFKKLQAHLQKLGNQAVPAVYILD